MNAGQIFELGGLKDFALHLDNLLLRFQVVSLLRNRDLPTYNPHVVR